MQTVNNIVVVSDLHCGCRLALCPPGGVPLDDGGMYTPSPFQVRLAEYWEYFFDVWVPEATRGEPWALVVNGDAIEGDHHHARTPFSTNPVDQCRCARLVLEPAIEKAAQFYMVRGTEAHVGGSAAEEEGLGRSLGAIPNRDGQFVRWDLWKRIGDGKLVHFLHHIGTTSSQSYEATAIGKELVEEYNEAARWRREPPDVIIRSHRHRAYAIQVPSGTADGETRNAWAATTPAWQGKTPHTWRIAGARNSTPQFGGLLVRYAHGRVFIDSKVWTVDRSPVEESVEVEA